MPLSAGTRLGPYEILSAVGVGGMGEVYRARDTKPDRSVAIKILPEAFAADSERIARFQREAKILASLNHPNIAHSSVLWFTVFVGLNLTQSAFTNWCPMMAFLRRLGVRDNRIALDRPAQEFHR